MKKLKNMIKLGCKVSVYVPSTTDINIKTDNSEQVAKTAEMLSSKFGGATATKALGLWMSDSQGLVREEVTIVYAYCTSEQLELHADDVVTYCENLRDEMKQEAVSLEINGELYFI